jgi:chaperonin cofactor prefoldin
MSDNIQDQIDRLKKNIDELRGALMQKANANVGLAVLEQVKHDLDKLDKRIDDLLEGTIKALTGASVSAEGLKTLKRK